MSRAGDGTYTLPLPDVVAGNTIDPAWANTTLTDIATALTDSLSRSGDGGMTAPLEQADGTKTAPSYSFTNAPDTGIYLVSATEARMSVNGNDAFRVKDTGTISVFQVWDGAAWVSIVDWSTLTATIAELNVLDGIPGTLTATELGYVDGVTSPIQAQIDAKAPAASPTFTGSVVIPTPATEALGGDDEAVRRDTYATNTDGGTIKVKIDGTTLYISIDSTDADAP